MSDDIFNSSDLELTVDSNFFKVVDTYSTEKPSDEILDAPRDSILTLVKIGVG